jgi:hypothetical protein
MKFINKNKYITVLLIPTKNKIYQINKNKYITVLLIPTKNKIYQIKNLKKFIKIPMKYSIMKIQIWSNPVTKIAKILIFHFR